MLLGTGSQSTGLPASIIDCTMRRHPGIETNARSADEATIDAITLFTSANALCETGWRRSNGNATSWNITQTESRRRDLSHKQNGTFAAFQPNACGTY